MKGPSFLRAGGISVPTGSHAGKVVFLGADHRGFRMKEWLKRKLKARGWKVRDLGTHSPRRMDYPKVMARVARAVGRTRGMRAVGIGVCGSGVGATIPAAKVDGVYPAMVRTVRGAKETRTHNNTNFLSLAADTTSFARALSVTEAWLKEPFFTDPARDRVYLRRYLQTVKLERRGR